MDASGHDTTVTRVRVGGVTSLSGVANTCVRSIYRESERRGSIGSRRTVGRTPILPNDNADFKETPWDMTETTAGRAEAERGNSVQTCDQMDDQEDQEGPQTGRSPVSINAITTRDTIGYKEDGAMGCDAAYDRQEQTDEPQREISTRSSASAELVKPIDAMNDTALVHERSGTHSH